MSSNSIPLSPRHGVNPAIPICFYCQVPKNEIILAGRLPGDAEAPKGVVWDKEPCDQCKGHMSQGVVLISTRDGDEGSDNPYRTGGWVVIKDEAIQRMITSPTREALLERRVGFVPDSAWEALGLPMGEAESPEEKAL